MVFAGGADSLCLPLAIRCPGQALMKKNARDMVALKLPFMFRK
jgi:hypothetical protein